MEYIKKITKTCFVLTKKSYVRMKSKNKTKPKKKIKKTLAYQKFVKKKNKKVYTKKKDL